MHDHVHFMISGWGVGWDKVRAWQNEAHLPNVSLMEPVTDADLESFLAAADAWIIPYLPNLAGVSVPSRLYNLLAVGRPVIGLTEPGSELSLIIDEGDVGWTSPPGNPEALADLLLRLSDDKSAVERKGHGGVRLVVERYTRGRSIESYRTLVRRIAGSTR
jgi:glycosyltransferase involved in cell wall biosynthesis